jgi:hypothetical protein
LRLAGAVSALLFLGACGSLFDDGKIVVVCPVSGTLDQGDRFTTFAAGKGQDLTDVILDARITDMATQCHYEPDERIGEVRMLVEFEIARGPAATETKYGFAYFVAISDPDGRILVRKQFDIEIEFPGNRGRTFTVEELTHRIPVNESARLEDYRVYVGMQLTPKQLEFNRRTKRMR